MKKAFLAAAAATILALGGIHAEAQAGPPPGWIHVDAKAGCVFGNAPHHWFKPSGEGLLFALVFESDDDDAQPVAIELAVTPEGYAKLSDDVKKDYHNHEDEVAMGEITVPGMDAENTKNTLEFLSTTRGRMILISEVADLAPIERTHIPTEPQAYTGTVWRYTPAQ